MPILQEANFSPAVRVAMDLALLIAHEKKRRLIVRKLYV